MKSYWVIWTYCANFSAPRRVEAADAQQAADRATAHYSDDFRRAASVYVFEAPPVLSVLEGVPVTVARTPRGWEHIEADDGPPVGACTD